MIKRLQLFARAEDSTNINQFLESIRVLFFAISNSKRIFANIQILKNRLSKQ